MNCPYSKPEIGNNTWSLLHSIAAHSPEHPSEKQKRSFQDFFETFPYAYPCRPCAENFQRLLKEHPAKVDSRVELSIWLCQMHNIVNQMLNKPQFSCSIKNLDERWRKGPAGCYEDPNSREEEYFAY
jgi:FAD-linked sulfhydryl oxidase